MIGFGVRVEGLEKAVKQINDLIKDISNKTLTGMIRAGLVIQGESQRITPVDTGNLRSSAFTVWSGKGATNLPRFSGDRGNRMVADHNQIANEETSILGHKILYPGVSTGNTAFYAIFVHEGSQSHFKLVMPKKFQRKKAAVKVTDRIQQVGENKFLEKAILRNLDRIVAAIAEANK